MYESLGQESNTLRPDNDAQREVREISTPEALPHFTPEDLLPVGQIDKRGFFQKSGNKLVLKTLGLPQNEIPVSRMLANADNMRIGDEYIELTWYPGETFRPSYAVNPDDYKVDWRSYNEAEYTERMRRLYERKVAVPDSLDLSRGRKPYQREYFKEVFEALEKLGVQHLKYQFQREYYRYIADPGNNKLTAAPESYVRLDELVTKIGDAPRFTMQDGVLLIQGKKGKVPLNDFLPYLDHMDLGRVGTPYAALTIAFLDFSVRCTESDTAGFPAIVAAAQALGFEQKAKELRDKVQAGTIYDRFAAEERITEKIHSEWNSLNIAEKFAVVAGLPLVTSLEASLEKIRKDEKVKWDYEEESYGRRTDEPENRGVVTKSREYVISPPPVSQKLYTGVIKRG